MAQSVGGDLLEDAAEDSVSIAVENLLQKLMRENRRLKKEVIFLKDLNAVKVADYRCCDHRCEEKFKKNAWQCKEIC